MGPTDKIGLLQVLSHHFSFVDSDGDSWVAPFGAITNGASIPQALKLFVGSAYDQPTLPAAVLHDIYCQSKERTWQETDEMFYEALVTNGVSKHKAALLWAAVYAFGPHWAKPVAKEATT